MTIYMSSDSSTAVGNYAWESWNGGTTSATTVAVDSSESSAVWTVWAGPDSTTGGSVWAFWYQNGHQTVQTVANSPCVISSAEAKKQRLAREERMRMEVEAKKKADELLREVLDEKQREDYAATGTFRVVGGKTKNTYRVKLGLYDNVHVLSDDGEQIVAVLCGYAQPTDMPGRVPLEDNMLAQKLMLENEATEEVYLCKANRTEYSTPMPVG